MTYRQTLYDIQSLLKQTYENKEFDDELVLFWIEMYANRLRKQHDEKANTDTFLHVYKQVPIYTEQNSNLTYISLPENVFDLERDRAIRYITYDFNIDNYIHPMASVEFHRTTRETMKRLYFTEEESPRPDNPYWYRIGNTIYLIGIECIDTQYVEIGILATMNPANVCKLDAQFEFPEELYAILQVQILSIGKFGLMIPEDATNKGENRVSPDNMPIPRNTGVQNPNYTQPTQQQEQEL